MSFQDMKLIIFNFYKWRLYSNNSVAICAKNKQLIELNHDFKNENGTKQGFGQLWHPYVVWQMLYAVQSSLSYLAKTLRLYILRKPLLSRLNTW